MADTDRGAPPFPTLRQTVFDTEDVRGLAEFYRQLLGLRYRPGDEPPADPGAEKDWLVLHDAGGSAVLAFQQVAALPPATWPEGAVPQQLHLDLAVPDREQLDVQHARALALGARMVRDTADDPEEPVRVYADPSGHPFCLFVG